ncbi:MAG: hypothetical protein V4726_05635 [Verrucomicrobiota bacterium]
MTERPLDPITKAALGESAVRLALLVYADFPSGPVYIWSGFGSLFAEGQDWTGVGNLLAVEDITETTDSAQSGMAVRLSGIPSEIFTSITLGNYQNRRADVSLIVFDADGDPAGAPYPLFRGLMDSDTVRDSGAEVSVTISLESVMSDQLRPRIFRYTHEDQQTRHPGAGDKGLEFVAALQNLQLRWGQQ